MTNLDRKVDTNELICRCKGDTADIDFNKFHNALDIIDSIQDGKINLADVKYDQEKFKSYLEKIKKGNK